MAAYGALVSVMQIMDQLHRHPHPPISLDEKQSESLAANVTFLQEFLEGYNPHVSYSAKADPLESRIAEAAYAAEDVIESYIVDQINLARSKRKNWRAKSPNLLKQPKLKAWPGLKSVKSRYRPPPKKGMVVARDQIHTRSKHRGGKIKFYQGLEKVIEEMDQIKMEIKEKNMKEKKMGVQIIKKQQSTTNAASSSSSSTAHAQKVTTMVGFDDVLYEMLDKITGGERVRQIIPIVGMGGLGKTTLTRNIYANQLVKEHFDIRAWSTISQVHNVRKILTEILGQVDGDDVGDLSDRDLGVKLYKHLIGKRYLIVMDDMWSVEAWDVVRSFFPENENGSRVVVTTRLSNLASKFNYSDGLDMKFLDEASSWDLFSKTVFREKICPLELEEIGKKIVQGCRGLPLSIVVAGGLLSKCEATRENWELIEENLSSVVNSEDDGSCLQILYTSYNNLPVYIKPCFLHLGLFKEDEEIEVSILIPMWVAEGFIRPRDGKSLEEVAKEYIEELIDRHLILVEERDLCGDVRTFKVHDLVRDLAMREAAKDRFLYSLMKEMSSYDMEISQGIISTHRRIIAASLNEEYPFIEYVEDTTELSLVRTLMGKIPEVCLSLPSFRLMRVCVVGEQRRYEFNEEIFVRLLNLRILAVSSDNHRLLKIPSYLWNLQTLYIDGDYDEFNCGSVIWKMPQLRVVVTTGFAFHLPNPPLNGEEVILENLHTLVQVRNLKLSEEVLKRIPNVRILKLLYYDDDEEEEENDLVEEEEDADYCFNNLHRLNKLQDLWLIRHESYSPSMQELTLPCSLKQLTLVKTRLPWEEMASKIGCLPLLQVLILLDDAFIGSEWETVEGRFPSLKFLQIGGCDDLERWITDDSTHFPRLELLVLGFLERLGEIPSSIGDIPTLRSIKVAYCSDSVEESARRIVEEQEELGNQDIHLQVEYLSD